MQSFIFSLTTRVIFGSGTLDFVGEQARPLGGRALVVTGTTFARRSGLIDRLNASLASADITAVLFDQVTTNPRVSIIDAGGRIASREGVDFVIGFGGGSTLDAAKAIAVTAAAGRSIGDYIRTNLDSQPAVIERALPLVQVPIIASTGSETNDTAVVLDEASSVNASITDTNLQARVAIVDPTLTFTVPPHYTAVGGMNVVSQMLERYLTRDEFAVMDRMTEGLIRVVMDSLPRAMRRGSDLDARSNLSCAAALAPSIGFAGQIGFTPVRTMAQPLSAAFGVEHGCAVAALWPSYMRYALSNRVRLPQIGRFKRYALLGRQIFGVHETDDEVAAETSAYRFTNWLRGMEMPLDLHQLGIPDADSVDLGALARQAVVVSGDGRRLPGGLTAEDVENVYQGALRSR